MTKHKKFRLAVLLSGNGSNLQALMDDITSYQRQTEIVCVISNNANAYGLQRARTVNIETVVLEHNNFASRDEYDKALKQALDHYQPDLIALAGFMRILTDEFVLHYQGKLINIHPSLLPKYKGLHTHQRVIDAGETEHGASVHFVTPTLDDGPIILQAKVPVLEDDNAESLAQRVHEVEHIIYPMAVNMISEGRIKMMDKQVYLDGNPITQEQQVMQLT